MKTALIIIQFLKKGFIGETLAKYIDGAGTGEKGRCIM